jgi:hypothetical protein
MVYKEVPVAKYEVTLQEFDWRNCEIPRKSLVRLDGLWSDI